MESGEGLAKNNEIQIMEYISKFNIFQKRENLKCSLIESNTLLLLIFRDGGFKLAKSFLARGASYS